MSMESYKMWHKRHPKAVTECSKCQEPLGQTLVRAGITHHINNCPVKDKRKPVKFKQFSMHSAEAYPAHFKFRTT